MDVERIADDLWRWTAEHPDWSPGKDWDCSVGCAYVEGGDAIVLVDPLAPRAGEDAERFWRALDRDVERTGLPVSVLLSNRFHARSTLEVYRRFAGRVGCRIHVPRGAEEALPCSPTDLFADHEALPAGLAAHFVDGLDGPEVAFYLARHRALIVGDAVCGAGSGELRLSPASMAEESAAGLERYRRDYRPSLARLLELDFELVLTSHGEPVRRDARAALRRALGRDGPS